MPGFSPILPLKLNNGDGFALTQTYQDVARQNLKTLILTNPGERIMNPYFGVGLKRRLFDPKNDFTYNYIESEIMSQVSTYMPYIVIRKIIFNDLREQPLNNDVHNSLSIKIIYFVDALNISDELEVLVKL